MKKLLSLLLLSSFAMQAMDNAASQCAIEEKEFGGSIKQVCTYCLYQSDMNEHDLASVLREISSTFSTPFLILHIAESNGKFLVLHSDADLAKLIKGALIARKLQHISLKSKAGDLVWPALLQSPKFKSIHQNAINTVLSDY